MSWPVGSTAGVPPDAVRQRTAPELVAGLRVVTPRGLVDVSAAGVAAEAERALAQRLEAGDRGAG